MTPWATPPEQWAAWTQEEAVASPSDVLDPFDAEVARRLEAVGFSANLEQTAVTNAQMMNPHPSESDATLIRPTPNLDDFGDGDAAETMVHGTVPEDSLEIGLQAPESGLEVGLQEQGEQPSVSMEPVHEDPEPEDRTMVHVPSAEPSPAPGSDEDVDGLILPSLTTQPGLEETAPEAYAGGHTVIAPAPTAPPPSGETVIAPAPLGPGPAASKPVTGDTLIPTDAPAENALSADAVSGGTEIAPVVIPTADGAPPSEAAAAGGTAVAPVTPVAQTGKTLPPSLPEEPASAPEPEPSEPGAAETKTSDGEPSAMSSGTFRAIDIHDDDEPEVPTLKQKVVIGIPAADEDTGEIEADELVEDGDGLVEDPPAGEAPPPLPADAPPQRSETLPPPRPAEAPPPPPKESAKPPPPKESAKPPPAPPSRPDAAPHEAPAVEAGVETPPTPSGPAPAATPRAPGWPEEVFADHFVAMTRPNHAKLAKAEIEFFVQATGIQPGARVLDVGCGDGAHAIVLAQRGFAVTGLDLSPAQLSRAERAREALGVQVAFAHGDMRDMPVAGPFEAILCLGTSFGYYDDEENKAVLRAMAGLLAPGGRLLLHVFNRDHIIGRLPTRSWWQGHGCLVLDEAQMNFFNNRLAVHRTIVFEDGRQFEHRLQIRGYNAHELGRMCVDAGLRIVQISGSRLTRGRFYGASSADIWLVVEPKA